MLFSLYSIVLILCPNDPLLVGAKIKAMAVGQKRKEEIIDAKLAQEIEKLDMDIMKSSDLLRNSLDFLIPSSKYFILLYSQAFTIVQSLMSMFVFCLIYSEWRQSSTISHRVFIVQEKIN